MPRVLQKQQFTDAFQISSKKFRSIRRRIPVLESLFNNVVGLQDCNFIKKRFQHRYFPVNFAKFLRTPSFIEHLWWLLLPLARGRFENLIFA